MTRRVIYAKHLFSAVAGGVETDRAVLVEDDRIAAVGDRASFATLDAERLELGEVTLLPGFIDAHTHLSIRPGEGDQHGQLGRPLVWQALRSVANLDAMVDSGVTTARIMGEQAGLDFIVRDLVASGELRGPQLFVSGMALSAIHGHGRALGVADGLDGVRRAVRENLRDGADHIKFFMTGGVSSSGSSLYAYHYSREEVRAIVEEAHRAGRKVAVHAHGGEGVSICAEEGVDSIEHGSLLTDENVAAMLKHQTALTLTKSIGHHPDGIQRGDAKRPDVMAKLREARSFDEEVFGRLRAAGLAFALGTDSMHGLFGYEIQWLVERGVSVQEALEAATRRGAEVIGLDDRGTLEAGKRADLVALRGNVFETPSFTPSDVVMVMSAGKVIKKP